MAARVGASSRHGAKKWLASLFGETVQVSSSKSVVKERLQIILAHQRGSQILAGVDLAALQTELLECVQRHIQVSHGANINIAVRNEGQFDIFEMQVPVDGDKTVEGRTTSA